MLQIIRMLNMAGLLLHTDDVPPAARVALATAMSASADQRVASLLEAARILHLDSGLECEDACELVGLGTECDCQPTDH
jgi:hypothetical protein